MAGRSETARLIAELTLSDKLTPGVNKALGSVGRLESGLSRVGRGAGQVGAGLTRAGTRIAVGLGVGLGAAAKAAIDWEDAFTGVRKTVDASETEFEGLEKALRTMATEMPNSALELAAIAEAGGAMGIKAKDIEAFTRQVAILGTTTNVTAEDAAVALGQMGNIIGLTGDEFDNFAASLVDLGNKGNSTEAQILEIERRAGGAAKLFGIAKEQTLGWAAAAANLGLNEELAGTALQNLFIKMMPKYIKGNKTLQDVTGQTAKELKKSFEKDAGGALESFIAKLAAMPKDERLSATQKLFGKGSGIFRLVNGLADSYEQNLVPSLDNATKSWEAATAAQEEFDKKNATVRAAIMRLKNGIFEAGIVLADGFVPALGRASDKLSTFLKDPQNQQALKSIGEDIGKAIDKINWNEVLSGARTMVGVMKTALDYAKRIYDVFRALPTEVQGAIAGLVALNKLSGGLIGGGLGNIVGGLLGPITRNIGASLPGVGKAFVQPVFVTNMPAGGLGGGGGGAVGGAAKGGMGLLSKVFLVGEAIGLAALVLEVKNGISDANTAQSEAIKAGLDASIAGKSLPQLQTALAGVNQGITDLSSNPLYALVQGEALDNLRDMRNTLNAAITARGEGVTANDREDRNTKNPVPPAISEMRTEFVGQQRETKDKIAALGLEVQRKGEQTVNSISDSKIVLAAKAAETARQAAQAGRTSANATTAGSSRVVSAIERIPAPITNVYVSATTVTKKTTVVSRYGPTSGSRQRDHIAGRPGGGS